MDSCRAKSSGFLDALKFVLKLRKDSMTMLNMTYLHHCDNLTVTTRMAEYLRYNNGYPNQTTQAHMDIQLEICHYLYQLELKWNTSHVQGHQDQKKTASQLTWEETLNI